MSLWAMRSRGTGCMCQGGMDDGDSGSSICCCCVVPLSTVAAWAKEARGAEYGAPSALCTSQAGTAGGGICSSHGSGAPTMQVQQSGDARATATDKAQTAKTCHDLKPPGCSCVILCVSAPSGGPVSDCSWSWGSSIVLNSGGALQRRPTMLAAIPLFTM